MTPDKQRCTFISYPRINKDFALKLALELRAAGFPIWLDQLDIPTGVRWDDEIERALNDCEIFMVILTPGSINSDNVKDEIGYAIDNHKHILPVLLEPCNIPLRLRRFQYVDFTTKDHENGVESAKKILTGLIRETTLPRSIITPAPQFKDGQEIVSAKNGGSVINNVFNPSLRNQPDIDHLARQDAEANRKSREEIDRPSTKRDEPAKIAGKETERIGKEKGLVIEKAEREEKSKEEAFRLSKKKKEGNELSNQIIDRAKSAAAQKMEINSKEKKSVPSIRNGSNSRVKTEMDNKKEYKNQANSDHPATLLYLVDISGSMNATMQDGKTRIEVAKNAIQIAYAQMIQRSMRQGKIHPRYRIGMIAYSDDLYDVYGDLGSIISIDKIKDEGIPSISPQKSTNMAKAFRYAAKLIKDDIQSWPQKWLMECPPPMVINITDCEYNEKAAQDPLEFALSLQKISVPDGNVLVENIFITDQISIPGSAQDWQGYRFNDATGDLYGDKLLAMSSAIPSSYAQILREQAGLKIREGTAMMFPGITREFIKFGFVMSIVTGSQVMQSSRSRTPQ